MSGAMHTCRICGSDRVASRHHPREQMHGLGDEFEYFVCAECGCLQIAEQPADMSRYYPDEYYSIRPEPQLKRWLKDRRLAFASTGSGVVGSLANRILKRDHGGSLAFIPEDLPKTARVLEIGCGRGYLVEELFLRGYHRIRGIDPFLPNRAARSSPFRLERKSATALAAEDERFELIYLSHSLEHVFDQHDTLRAIATLLSDRGRAVFCLPWVDCDAWEIYGTDWVSLDAPRHFYLHSRKSLTLLVERAGLRIEHLYCDSFALQFWGSEQYRRGIPLFGPRSWTVDRKHSVFTAEQVDEWEARAKELNARERGDQVVIRVGRARGGA
jgi:SAM-dependent methyltransferase